MKYAVIDIGSNSVRLMLWAGGTLYKKLFTTRLAAGMKDGLLQEDAMRRTQEAVCAFYAEAVREAGPERTFAFATAAVRGARNGGDLCARVKDACGLAIDVIPGEREALLGALGAIGTGDGGTIDIGGASTEVFVRTGGKTALAVSLPVGVVRLKDGCGQDAARLAAAVEEALSPLAGRKFCVPFYAVGGTACTLACLLRGRGYEEGGAHGTQLSYAWVRDEAERLAALPLQARKALPGMEEKRADVITGGAVLLAGVMRTLGLDVITFSDADNLEGYLRYRGFVC